MNIFSAVISCGLLAFHSTSYRVHVEDVKHEESIKASTTHIRNSVGLSASS